MSKSLPAKSSLIYNAVRDNCFELVGGTVLIVDPSIGSLSSMPGWAAYIAGVLQDSGTLEIDTRLQRWERLKQVYQQLRLLSTGWAPDVCIYEEIPVSAHGGRSQVAHASLLNALGVTMAAIDAPAFIGVLPVVWKARVSPDYVKSDEQDAIEIGRIAIEMAQLIREKDPPRQYRRKSDV